MLNQNLYFIFRLNANKHAHSIQDITNKALGSGGLERIRPTNQQLMPTTGESKVPFSQGIVPRKGTTMPKPRWHAPWKLMRVMITCFLFRTTYPSKCTIFSLFGFFKVFLKLNYTIIILYGSI